MFRIYEYAVYDRSGALTRYNSLQSVLHALERDGLSFDSPDVKVYCTKVGVMIVDCY